MASTARTPTRRPLAFRTQSVDETWTQLDLDDNEHDGHVRRKSQYTASNGLPLSMRRAPKRLSSRGKNERPGARKISGLNAVPEGVFDERLRPSTETHDAGTPPITPVKSNSSQFARSDSGEPETMLYDFGKIDYEIDRAKAIGKGLWSHVYWAEPIVKSPGLGRSPLTPPSSPEQTSTAAPPCSLFAVKLSARPDSSAVFAHEARILTHLRHSRHSHHHIVPFHGLDPRHSSLVFEAVLGGSLENLVARLKVMTELARHLQLRAIFPSLALDLIAGLAFIHAAGVVHADIKPANILLDIADEGAMARPMLRARYIDFSAAFMQGEGEECLSNAGGTWDFMAPEQMRIQKDLNTPTEASDVWSVGVTLLYVLAGGSPYAAACGTGNLFMLREAIKTGDPLGFARMDPVVGKRMAACQDFVDCCRLALQRERDQRIGAEAWEGWVEAELFSDY